MPIAPLPQMTTRSAEVRTTDDVRFKVFTDASNKNDPVSDDLMAGVFPVPELYALLRRTTPPGARVLDLGAHVGSFSLAAAAAGYQVVAVEASPINSGLLAASIEANGFTNLQLVNVAVSDRPGSLQFHVHGPYGHVTPGGEGALTVEAVTVDDLLTRVGWDRVDFIKLDIEGSEVAAIRGMSGLMARSDAPLLFCESNGHMLNVFGESPQSLKSALQSAGCDVYLFERERLVRVQPAEMQGRTVVDYLAAKFLPPALSGMRIDQGLTEDEQVAGLKRSMKGSVDERLYALRVLRDSTPAFRANSKAEAIRAALELDPASSVGELARSIRPVTRIDRPWWKFF